MAELQDKPKEKFKVIKSINESLKKIIGKILHPFKVFFTGTFDLIGTMLGNIVAGFLKATDFVKFFQTIFLWVGIVIIYKSCIHFLPFFSKDYIFFLVPVIVIFNKIFNK